MKSLFWRSFWCLLPVALAGWITANAMGKYQRGEQGGFKLGTDLVGGTILVYEIDFRKGLQDKESGQSDPQRDTNLLAESLKRRIDPNDLYNIVIRPAGGEGRVEIILPTGGKHREERAQEAWNKLLEELNKRHEVKLEVGRGKVQELADRIHLTKALHVWKESLFKKESDWKDLWPKALEWWPELGVNSPDTPKDAPKDVVRRKAKFETLKAGDFKGLGDLLQTELGARTSEKDVEAWLKKEAWNKLLVRVREKWKELKDKEEEINRILPDANEQLTTFILAKGDVVGQAGISILEPLLGYDPVEEKEVKDFLASNYGPSLHSISKEIDDLNKESGRSRDLTVEEVQRIKDLVSKVGNLEFRILANSVDDEKAISAATRQLNDTPENLKDTWAKQGKAPPGPEIPGTRKLEEFQINLPRQAKSIVTYSWVELGPQERNQLGLDNAAKTDPKRGSVWIQAANLRNQAGRLKDPYRATDRFLLQGALFYSRECKDTNLPETERRAKAVEYFILCRNPEMDPATGQPTPAIDGRYLVNASGQNYDGRPTVSFSFNSTGGDLFGNMTRKNVPSGSGSEETQIRRHLAIILDGLVMTAPTVNSEIRQQGQITGTFTQREVDALVNILRSGALPASLKPQPVSESTMAATLGVDTVRMGMTAVLWAFVAVLAFMVFVYRFAGLVASIALLAQLILTVGFMVFVSATFTLPGIAGLVLTLGMAVDANVLIYERIREERARGATLFVAIRQGYDRAFTVIIDTHLSSIFTAVVLYVVGNDQLKGFGISMTVGLIISLFTSLVVTRLIFDIWLARGWLTNLSMMQFFKNTQVDFMSARKLFFTMTIILSVLGIGLFIGRLPHDLNIDFVGGTAYGGQLNKAQNIEELRAKLDDSVQKTRLNVANVKELDTPNAADKDAKLLGGHFFEVTFVDPDKTQSTREILLANRADGDTPAEREASVKQRASRLPDFSVEQLFPSNLDPAVTAENRSPYFTVRTSEREAELVQIAVDRLLSDQQPDGKLIPLLKTKYLRSEPLTEKGTRLHFYAKEPGAKFDPVKDQEQKDRLEPEYASPSFFKTLLMRELNKAFGAKTAGAEKTELPFKVDLTGEGRTNQEGRYQALRVVFEPPLTQQQTKKVQEALTRTEEEFRRRPQPELLENFDSQLAAETRVRAMWAILASWAAVALYLWFRFGNWTFGLAAVLCLVHDLFFTMGLIAVGHYITVWMPGVANLLLIEDFKLDLTAVAALLTVIGYAVNDTIVVFDRAREVRGKNPDLTPQMINDTVNQTLGRTLLTGMCTLLVLVVLYIWGGPGVHLFAFIVMVGVVIGTYGSIYIACPLLLILGEGQRSEKVERRGPAQPVGATV